MRSIPPSAAVRRLVPTLVALALAGMPAFAKAQVPSELGYQGRLLKADGTPVTGVQQLTFSLYDATTGGTALWTETDGVPLTRGFYSVLLGKTTAFPAGLFDGRVLYLEVAVGSETLTPRQEVGSVAYAMMANTARNVAGGSVDASSISVNGSTVIDGSGKLAGSAALTAGPGIDISGGQVGLVGTCAAGQVLKWDGTTWGCAADDNNLGGLSCASGQVAKYDGANWICATDQVNTYTAGDGLALTGTTFSLLPGCAAGQVAKYDGTAWACGADTNTTYTAGDGLALTGTTFSLLPGCAAGQVPKWNGTKWACAADANTTYAAGTDLTISGTTFNVTAGRLIYLQDVACTNPGVLTTTATCLTLRCGTTTPVRYRPCGGGTCAYTHPTCNNKALGHLLP